MKIKTTSDQGVVAYVDTETNKVEIDIDSLADVSPELHKSAVKEDSRSQKPDGRLDGAEADNIKSRWFTDTETDQYDDHVDDAKEAAGRYVRSKARAEALSKASKTPPTAAQITVRGDAVDQLVSAVESLEAAVAAQPDMSPNVFSYHAAKSRVLKEATGQLDAVVRQLKSVDDIVMATAIAKVAGLGKRFDNDVPVSQMIGKFNIAIAQLKSSLAVGANVRDLPAALQRATRESALANLSRGRDEVEQKSRDLPANVQASSDYDPQKTLLLETMFRHVESAASALRNVGEDGLADSVAKAGQIRLLNIRSPHPIVDAAMVPMSNILSHFDVALALLENTPELASSTFVGPHSFKN